MTNLPLIPQENEWRQIKEICSIAVSSGFLPTAVNTPQKAAVIALKGRELGLPPMQAFSSIAVIQGKPTMGAELMLSLIYKNCPGAVINFLEVSDERCVLEAKRPSKESKFTRFEFNLADAKKAGLLAKDSWVKYTRAMLKARVITEMARTIFPDAISGVSYTAEELGADVEMTDDGLLEVKTVSPPIPNLAPKREALPKQEPSPQAEPVYETEPPQYEETQPSCEDLDRAIEASAELDQMAINAIEKDVKPEPPTPQPAPKRVRKYTGINTKLGDKSPVTPNDILMLSNVFDSKKYTVSQRSTAIKKLTAKSNANECTREELWDVIGFVSTKTISDLAVMK